MSSLPQQPLTAYRWLFGEGWGFVSLSHSSYWRPIKISGKGGTLWSSPCISNGVLLAKNVVATSCLEDRGLQPYLNQEHHGYAMPRRQRSATLPFPLAFPFFTLSPLSCSLSFGGDGRDVPVRAEQSMVTYLTVWTSHALCNEHCPRQCSLPKLTEH